jgi:hypothetical protein
VKPDDAYVEVEMVRSADAVLAAIDPDVDAAYMESVEWRDRGSALLYTQYLCIMVRT